MSASEIDRTLVRLAHEILEWISSHSSASAGAAHRWRSGWRARSNRSSAERRLGAPADVTIFSTDVEWTYDVNQSFSKSRNSPFNGRTFRGGPMATIVSGNIVWRRG